MNKKDVKSVKSRRPTRKISKIENQANLSAYSSAFQSKLNINPKA